MGFFDTLANQITNQVIDGVAQQVENRVDEVVRDHNPLRNVNLNLGTGHINSKFKIYDFITNLTGHNEVAKADKFFVNFQIPQLPRITSAGQSGPTVWSDDRDISLQCEISELPCRDINMIEYRHYGFIRRIPHTNAYGIASFTFYCAGDMHEKKMFDSWLDCMVPTNSGLVTYPLDEVGQRMYETDIEVNQYDPMGNMMYQAKLIDAIPTSISALNQNWSDDSVHRLTVTFAFRKWISPATDALIQPSILFGEVDVEDVPLKDGDGEPIASNNTNNSDLSEINLSALG